MFVKSAQLRFNRTALRSTAAAKAKNRMRLKAALFLLLAVLASAAVVWAYGAVKKAAMRNTFFTVKTITIIGTKRLDDRRLRGLLTVALSGNIFTRDIEKVTLLLEKLPAVESASIRLKLPDLAEVNIVERKPAVSLIVKGKTYLMDSRRYLIEEAPRGLPGGWVITGWNGVGAPGERILDGRLDDALAAAALFALDSYWHEKAVSVDLGDTAKITAISSSGVFLRLGPDKTKWREKFFEYMSARRIAADMGARFEGYDLSFENQVVGVNMGGSLAKNQTNKIKG